MDSLNRVKQLAGIPLEESDQHLMRQLNEYVELTSDISMEDLMRRMDACKRALGIANKLPDKADRLKWVSAVFVNMNKIRAGLKKAIEQMQQEQ